MHAGLASHCRQEYAGSFEIVFGVSSLDDPAVGEIERLRAEFPSCSIRLVECRERLGTSGKVSNLVQMLREARYEHVLINDSDIFVSPGYLTRVMSCFSDASVGLVTVPYIGRTAEARPAMTIWSRLEALGISTDFFSGGAGCAVAGGRNPVRAGLDAGDFEDCAREGGRAGAAGGVSCRRL